MFIFFVILSIAILGSDAYLCFGLLKSWPLLARLAIWLPSILTIVCLTQMGKGNWGWPVTTFIVLMFCIIVPKLLFCIFTLLGKLLALAYHPIGAWSIGIGLAVAGVVALCALYGVTFGWKHSVTNNIEVKNAALPDAFQDYKIVQITDLHLGTFGTDPDYIQSLVGKINALQPDLIVFTGDLVNFTYQEAQPFKNLLSQLQAPDGVISILGNHDYGTYARMPSEAATQRLVDSLIATERDMGWRLLLDENIPITRGNDTIWVAGVENIGRHFSANKGDLKKALAGIPDGAYTILLSHDPSHWEDEVIGKTDIALTLSGHTHAMQIKLFGWSPSSLIFERWGGLHAEGSQQMYVSTGAGGNLPFRFGAWPEIALLTLSK